MPGKVALLAVCFCYTEDARLQLPAVPKDLKKVASYAAWLGADVYLVSDWDADGTKTTARLRVTSPQATNSPLLVPAKCDWDSPSARSVCEFVDQIAADYVLVYYSGHATNKSMVFPDGSKLSVAFLHRRVSNIRPRGICWVLDGCELSGKSLRLPFLCAGERVARVMPHGLHLIPTVAVSASVRDAEFSDAGVVTVTEYEGFLKPGPRSFITDDNGSLFTSAIFPLLMAPGLERWDTLLGGLSKCCGYRDEVAVCLKLHVYFSDIEMARVPFWMLRKRAERKGDFWIVHN